MQEYEILEEIGKGSYASVYKVKKKTDGKIFALKREESNEFFNINELDILFRFNHPYILKGVSFFYDKLNNEELYSNIILPYAPFNLDIFIRKFLTTISMSKKIDIMFKLSCALSFIHQQHIYHGDVKPSNILLFEDEPYLSDFNLSFPLENENTYCGSPLYTSPQGLQYIHKPKNKELKNFDMYHEDLNFIQTDIYSLGCVFLFIITGKNFNYYLDSKIKDFYEMYNEFIDKYKNIIIKSTKDESLTDLLYKMLQPSQKNRLKSMDEVIKHPFFVNKNLNYLTGSLKEREIELRNDLKTHHLQKLFEVCNYKCNYLIIFLTIYNYNRIGICYEKEKYILSACLYLSFRYMGEYDKFNLNQICKLFDLKIDVLKKIIPKILLCLEGKIRDENIYDFINYEKECQLVIKYFKEYKKENTLSKEKILEYIKDNLKDDQIAKKNSKNCIFCFKTI